MATVTHESVLSVNELELWRAVRVARQSSSGNRAAAIGLVAARRDLDPELLNTQIADMKRRLVAAGAVPRERFFAYPASGMESWHVTSAPERSQRCAEISGQDDTYEFGSAKFAFNAAAALNAHGSLDVNGRGMLAGQLRELAALGTCGQAEERRAELSVDRVLAAVRFRDTVGFYLSDLGTRPWTGTPAHACWVAEVLEVGTLEHLCGVAVLR